MPSTSRSCSRLENPPIWSRYAVMRSASTAPMWGSCSSSAAEAAFSSSGKITVSAAGVVLSGAVRVSWEACPARLAEAVFVRRVPVCRVVSAAETAASVPVVSTVAAASRWGRAESSLSETCRVPCQNSSPTAPASRTVVPPRISHFKHSCFMRSYPVLRKNSLLCCNPAKGSPQVHCLF